MCQQTTSDGSSWNMHYKIEKALPSTLSWRAPSCFSKSSRAGVGGWENPWKSAWVHMLGVVKRALRKPLWISTWCPRPSSGVNTKTYKVLGLILQTFGCLRLLLVFYIPDQHSFYLMCLAFHLGITNSKVKCSLTGFQFHHLLFHVFWGFC